MKYPLAMVIVLCAASAALGQGTSRGAHPAVVRVIATEQGGASCGSGALVGVNQTYGLVVTNWHVVRDARGPITVIFPDGFQSPATVLAANRDWDLAALAIWRPQVAPIPLATEAPRLGEVLTIAGYGRGWYRAAAGRCTQYVSPGRNCPFEMVELDTPARSGDSGGPILNQRGELAGVLFGSGFGRTTGSYCGRVRWFLDSVAGDFRRLPSSPTMIAQQPSAGPNTIARRPRPKPDPIVSIGGQWTLSPSSEAPDQSPVRCELAELPIPRPPETPVADVSTPTEPLAGPTVGGPNRAEQIKTILAAIGILALLLHGLRLLAVAGGS